MVGGPGEERRLGLSVSGLEDSEHEAQGLCQRFSPGGGWISLLRGHWQYLGAFLVARAGWRRSDAGGL